MSKNLSYLSGRKGLDRNLFEKLGELGEGDGTPAKEDIKKLAREYLMGDANLYGAATFYDFLKPENKNKKVFTCSGSVCMMAGTQEDLKGKLLNSFKEEEIGEMCCLGRCHENSAFNYNNKNYSGDDIDDFQAIIDEPGNDKGDSYGVKALGETVLTGAAPDSAYLVNLLKQVIEGTPEDAIEKIKESGIRGRGGAGFPMGLKFESCKNTPGNQKYVVCNADEGDPGAYSDRYLLEEQPELVMLGMIIAGYAIGANFGVLYIRAEYPESITIIENKLRVFAEQGLVGEGILGSNFDFHLKLVKARGAYICGEETALLSSLEGQRPEVRVRPPYPTQEGLFNMPTVVNNVETLAALPFIISNGGNAYSGIGTSKSSGTKLISLDSFFNKPGVYEVDMGTPLRAVIDELGGGFRVSVKAIHIGGPLGGLVPISKIDDLSIDFESFSNEGFLLGHGSVVCIPEDYPLVEYLEHLFDFTAEESCGKCFPCRLGSVRGYEMLKKARTSDYKIDRTLFDDLLVTLEEGSLCALGGGLPLAIQNALQYFEEELKPYFNQP